ncbi:MAG: hypothetical protein LLG04_02560 [Parachlamydia sp.]|nr:hypothetical protein [Parachlamydia sp.]
MKTYRGFESHLFRFFKVHMVKPDDVLKDDQSFTNTERGSARKGSIAATILNANELDSLLGQPSSEERNRRIEATIQDIRDLVPALHTVALFDFFTPLEWLHTLPALREGRAFVAILYLQQYPRMLDHELRSRLDQVKKIASPDLKKEIEKLLS